MTGRSTSDMGTMVVDERVCLINRLWFEGGELHVSAWWPDSPTPRAGEYDVVLFGPDGTLIVRGWSHINFPRKPVRRGALFTYSITFTDGISDEVRERESVTSGVWMEAERWEPPRPRLTVQAARLRKLDADGQPVGEWINLEGEWAWP